MQESLKSCFCLIFSVTQFEMFLLVLLCLLAVVCNSTEHQDCSLNTCNVFDTFKKELEAIKNQILLQNESSLQFKKLERRLRSLEQTSAFYSLLFKNEITINFIVL